MIPVQNSHRKIIQFTSALIVIAAILTLLLSIYIATPWKHDTDTDIRLLPYYVWTIFPYFILLWFNTHYHRRRIQAVTNLVFTLIVIVIGIAIFAYAIMYDRHPLFNMELILLPLWQFIISVMVLPFLIYMEASGEL